MSEQELKFRIGTDKESRQELPEGESFPRTGLVGAWRARLLWEAGWFETNIPQAVADVGAELRSSIEDLLPTIQAEDGSYYDHVRPSRSGKKFVYYYKDKTHAEACCAIADREEPFDFQRRPSLQWVFEANLDDVFGLTNDAKEKFSNPVRQYTKIMTFRSKKQRHEYQLLALPSFITAYAKAAGLEVPDFDLSDLTVPDDKLIINADTQVAHIGDADGYKDSFFWKQREALSKALGEPEAHNWKLKDSGSKQATVSDTLSTLLEATVEDWATPIYLRLVTVWDPREKATMGEGEDKTRLTIPVVTQFFSSLVRKQPRRRQKANAPKRRKMTPPAMLPGSMHR
jgi:hypothetical protein